LLVRLAFLFSLLGVLLIGPAGTPDARAQDLGQALLGLKSESFDDKIKAIASVATTGDARAEAVLQALAEGSLMLRKSDGRLVIAAPAGGEFALIDAGTGEDLGNAPKDAVERVRTNNRMRREIQAALGGLTLLSKDPQTRLRAAEAVFKARDPAAISALDAAIAAEQQESIRVAMREARAAAVLAAPDRSVEEKVAAVSVLEERADDDALSILRAAIEAGPEPVSSAAEAAAARIESTLALWSNVQTLIYGLSLGSVLLLAAIGLAITFGVMGVINMAHGEMVMIGAYVTFVVQETIRTSAPYLFDWSLLIALPLAFLVAGAVGIAIERGIIRFLYTRPLETLLATFGVSLILQQAVRTIFGPNNREVGNPSWMSGSLDIGQVTLTWGRINIILFALAVFVVLLFVINKTSFGLKMRAVVQNRRMAASMGIRTDRVDALTFGLGSGIAGIAGVALSQIDNVSPNLGQSYIIDSFLVVVFGGVGNLWGTLVGALTLGVANKFMEPFAGAVLGKIAVLIAIILFIQKRPRGLFALKGRAVEA